MGSLIWWMPLHSSGWQWDLLQKAPSRKCEESEKAFRRLSQITLQGPVMLDISPQLSGVAVALQGASWQALSEAALEASSEAMQEASPEM